MAIPDHKINDLDSFNAVTGGARGVAGLYFFYKLDGLIELAHRISHDFYDRPELFTDLNGDAGVIARLHARYGCDESFLNDVQRQAIYAPLFGASGKSDGMGEEGNFPNLRDELLEACATFVETKFSDAPSLRENVRQKHRLFVEYLTGLAGDSVSWSRDNALSALSEEVSYRILRNKGVSAVYGIAAPPSVRWPYDFDSNADKLIEKASKQLMQSENDKPDVANGAAEMHRYISREEITNRQRTAIEGANAIATAIDVTAGSTDDDIDLLIRKCYTWGTALSNLMNYSRPFSRRVAAGAADRTRGGIAVAQPLAGAMAQPARG